MKAIELTRKFDFAWSFLIALGISMFLSPLNVTAVTLSSPAGGDVIPSGAIHDIVWSSGPMDLTFTLKYSLDNGVTWTTAKDESGNRAIKVSGTTFAWKVPRVSNNKRKCLIKAIAYGTTGSKSGIDRSGTPFAVEVVKLRSPNGEEAWHSGRQHTITWDSHITVRPVARVLLSYTRDNGVTWEKIISINVVPGNAIPGFYDWDVPPVSKTMEKCRVKVVLKDVNGASVGSDLSDGLFMLIPPDSTPPYVLSTIPANNSTNVPVNTTLTATFSESLDPSTLSTATFLLSNGSNPVSGSVVYAGTTATFSPFVNLSGSTTYTATITPAVKDLAGNPMATAYSWTFTTGATPDAIPPTVSSTVPDNGEADVGVNTVVTATFSEAMDLLTINSGSFLVKDNDSYPVSGSVAYAGTTATFSPFVNLSGSTTYTATITPAVKDLAGNPMATAYSWTFTTGDGPDTIPPRIVSTNPPSGAVGVALDEAITATFNEEMNAATINTNSFYVKFGTEGTFFAGDVSYAGRTATFTPIQFTYDSLLVATVTTAAHDQAGNAMTSSYSWQFRTIAPPEAALDPTFGTDGVVKTEFEGSSSQYGHGAYVSSLIIQPDGKIVAAGSSYRGPTLVNDFALARYNSDGTIDDTFGTFGKVVQGFGGDDYLKDIVLQSDGKIVAIGNTYAGPNGNIVLVRYGANGSLDPTFGTDGVVIPDLGGNDFAYGLGLQSDGKIVVGGSGGIGAFLARYNSDGTLDSTFGSNGIAVVSHGLWYTHSLMIQDDDKIVIGGALAYDFAVVRYNADGTSDTTFGTGGKVITDFDGGTEDVESLAIQPDGKIIAAGWSLAGYYVFALTRYNPDGSLDATFGTDGKATTSLGGGASGSAGAVVIQPDGKVVLAGGVNYYPGSSNRGSDFALVRYDGDGTLDTTFGVGGKAFTDLGNTGDQVNALVIQPDGKIVAAGSSALDFALVRYLP